MMVAVRRTLGFHQIIKMITVMLLGLVLWPIHAHAVSTPPDREPVLPVEGGIYEIGQPIIFAPHKEIVDNALFELFKRARVKVNENPVEWELVMSPLTWTTQTVVLNRPGSYVFSTYTHLPYNPFGPTGITNESTKFTIIDTRPSHWPETAKTPIPKDWASFTQGIYSTSTQYLSVGTVDNSFSRTYPEIFKVSGYRPLYIKEYLNHPAYLSGEVVVEMKENLFVMPGQQSSISRRFNVIEIEVLISKYEYKGSYILRTNPYGWDGIVGSGVNFRAERIYETFNDIPKDYPMAPATAPPSEPYHYLDANRDRVVDCSDILLLDRKR